MFRTRPSLPLVVLMFVLLAAAHETAKNGSGSGNDLLGTAANLIVVLAVVYLLWQWLRWRDWSEFWRKPWKRKLTALLGIFRLSSPVKVEYLLPKRLYHLKEFPHAAAEESYRSELTIGTDSYYEIPIAIRATTDLSLEQVRLTLDERDGLGDRPRSRPVPVRVTLGTPSLEDELSCREVFRFD